MITKINGKVIDITDLPQIMAHGTSNYGKAEKMLNSGMDINEVKEFFCINCGPQFGQFGISMFIVLLLVIFLDLILLIAFSRIVNLMTH